MRRTRWQQRLYRIWYGKSVACIALLPLSWLYCAATAVRRLAYRSGLLATTRLDSRVIVVGNISVGGTGKTVTEYLVPQFQPSKYNRFNALWNWGFKSE